MPIIKKNGEIIYPRGQTWKEHERGNRGTYKRD